jgi:hypothetical protein
MSNGLQIEVLYLEGCPNHQPAVEQLRQALRAEAIATSVDEIEVKDAVMAQEIRFLGSPSVRVNGMDVEEAARDAKTFGFGCRTYFEKNRRSALPSVELIRRALANAVPAPTVEEQRSDQ